MIKSLSALSNLVEAARRVKAAQTKTLAVLAEEINVLSGLLDELDRHEGKNRNRKARRSAAAKRGHARLAAKRAATKVEAAAVPELPAIETPNVTEVKNETSVVIPPRRKRKKGTHGS